MRLADVFLRLIRWAARFSPRAFVAACALTTLAAVALDQPTAARIVKLRREAARRRSAMEHARSQAAEALVLRRQAANDDERKSALAVIEDSIAKRNLKSSVKNLSQAGRAVSVQLEGIAFRDLIRLLDDARTGAGARVEKALISVADKPGRVNAQLTFTSG